MYDYAMVLEPDDNGTILVTCPDIPALATFGDDDADALRHAQGALVAALSAMMDSREDIPVPSAPAGRPTVRPPLLVELKLVLYRELRAQRLTQAALAHLLHMDPKQVQRLLDLTHASRLDQVETALAALGRRVRFDIRKAA